MKNSTFHLHWASFFISLFLGIFAFIFYVVFATGDRRDKIYSSLFGWFLATAVWLLLLRFTDIKSALPPGTLR
jgi:4-amino-4-deoxy-L-arabinose transferase-like glycosyltransferase